MKNLAALLYVLLVSSNPLPLHTLSLPSGEKGRVLFPQLLVQPSVPSANEWQFRFGVPTGVSVFNYN